MSRSPSWPRLTRWLVPVVLLGLVGGSAGVRPRSVRLTGYQHYFSRPDLVPPTVTVTTPARRVAPGYIVLAPKNTGGQGGPMIVDNTGEVVWFDPDRGAEVTDARVQKYQGQPVLTWWEGASKHGHGQGSYVLMDTSYHVIARVQAGNGYQGDLHEFRITPRGTALITAYRAESRDLSAVGGPRAGTVLDSVAQEIDIATGKVLFEWHSLDHIPLSESFLPVDNGGTAAEPYDYFHINSVAPGPHGSLLISSRHAHTVYDVNRDDGSVLWRLGGKKSDFTMGPGTQFRWQHDAQQLPDGTITIFDNGDNGDDPDAEPTSRALRLRLDTTSMRATLVHAYPHPDGLLASSQGDVQVLPDGHVFVGWGSTGTITEFDRGGRVLLDGAIGGGSKTDSYRAYRMAWTGHPTEPPVAAATERADGGSTVWVSWNGATEVASWQLFTGPAPDRLTPAGVTARSGFETRIPVDGTPTFASVRALDGSGAVLASTAVVDLKSARSRAD
ncbi:MAG TPA: arylsulfotransferase family protein [Mycobacteriales bacterium]|nr:arylsulfotransferase family protein [Mycobacteriales bacterium]